MSIQYSPFDLTIIVFVSFHLLFSLAAASFVLHFHRRSSSSSPSLRHRLHLLLRLNALWPIRLLLIFFASVLSLSELLRLPRNRPYLCKIYALSSQSLAQPAYFATLLLLIRASTQSKPSSPSPSFALALSIAVLAALPFLTMHILYIILSPSLLRKFLLPPDFFSSSQSPNGRCNHTLFGTMLLAILGAIYVPLFISTCWSAMVVVINKRLGVRLYTLAATVIVALLAQVSSLALSSLWNPNCMVGQGLGVISFGSVLVCVTVGQGILVIQPVVDALAIVEQETVAWDSRGQEGESV